MIVFPPIVTHSRTAELTTEIQSFLSVLDSACKIKSLPEDTLIKKSTSLFRSGSTLTMSLKSFTYVNTKHKKQQIK